MENSLLAIFGEISCPIILISVTNKCSQRACVWPESERFRLTDVVHVKYQIHRHD